LFKINLGTSSLPIPSNREPPIKRSRSSDSLRSLNNGSPFSYSAPNSPSSDKSDDSSCDGEYIGESHGNEYNYIDITDLLVLPQKEAARRLGISESMLCKRFKECTRRKWPYRYVINFN
jgi:hypothetical protein